jgi:hypothetical protein
MNSRASPKAQGIEPAQTSTLKDIRAWVQGQVGERQADCPLRVNRVDSSKSAECPLPAYSDQTADIEGCPKSDRSGQIILVFENVEIRSDE